MTDELDKNQNKSEDEDLSCEVPAPATIGGEDLGLAGTIAKTFINSPVTPMLLIATLLIGLSGLIFTPRQEDPQISVPMIDIFVSYPGTSAPQVMALPWVSGAAPTADLSGAQAAMKKYNATRKLKKAALGLMAKHRMAKLMEAGRAQQ